MSAYLNPKRPEAGQDKRVVALIHAQLIATDLSASPSETHGALGGLTLTTKSRRGIANERFI